MVVSGDGKQNVFSMERVHRVVYEELYCIDAQHHPHEEEVGWLRVQKRECPVKSRLDLWI